SPTMFGILPQEIDSLMTAVHRSAPPQISINCFVIHSAGRVALIDTGCGTRMTDQQGKLFTNLQLAGVSIDDIDTVILTHMRPDHSNARTAVSGTTNFPKAELVWSEIDVKHWHDDAARAAASTRHQDRFFMGARFQLAPYRERLRDNRSDFFPGITSVPLPG